MFKTTQYCINRVQVKSEHKNFLACHSLKIYTATQAISLSFIFGFKGFKCVSKAVPFVQPRHGGSEKTLSPLGDRDVWSLLFIVAFRFNCRSK